MPNRILSARFRSASMMPLMPSPGIPKTTSPPPIMNRINQSVGSRAFHAMGLSVLADCEGDGL